MTQKERSESSSSFMDNDQVEAILNVLPPEARLNLEAPIRSGDPRRLLVVFRNLRDNLDRMIKGLEEKYGE